MTLDSMGTDMARGAEQEQTQKAAAERLPVRHGHRARGPRGASSFFLYILFILILCICYRKNAENWNFSCK